MIEDNFISVANELGKGSTITIHSLGLILRYTKTHRILKHHTSKDPLILFPTRSIQFFYWKQEVNFGTRKNTFP